MSSSPVLLSDCKSGDQIMFRPGQEADGFQPPKYRYRVGTIRSINKARGTLLVVYGAVIDGKLVRDCRRYIKPEDVIGFLV